MTPNLSTIEAEIDYSLWRLSVIKKLADDPQASIRRPQPDWTELTREADELMARVDLLKSLLP